MARKRQVGVSEADGQRRKNQAEDEEFKVQDSHSSAQSRN